MHTTQMLTIHLKDGVPTFEGNAKFLDVNGPAATEQTQRTLAVVKRIVRFLTPLLKGTGTVHIGSWWSQEAWTDDDGWYIESNDTALSALLGPVLPECFAQARVGSWREQGPTRWAWRTGCYSIGD